MQLNILYTVGSTSPTQPSTSGEGAVGGAVGGSNFMETTSIMNELPPEIFGMFIGVCTDTYVFYQSVLEKKTDWSGVSQRT